MTPWSISRCTRWRTAASDSPTTLPIAAYERRPSCCSWSMMALDTSSSGGRIRSTRPFDLLMAHPVGDVSERSTSCNALTSESVGLTPPQQRIHLWTPGYRGRIPSPTPPRHRPAPRPNPPEDTMSRTWRPPLNAALAGSGLSLPGMSRRGLLRGAAIGGTGVALPSLLASCGTKGGQGDAGECTSTDRSAEEKTLVFGNWIGYTRPAKKADTSTLEKFQQQTGIKVDYRNGDVNDNESFFAKVSPQLQSCKSTGRDIFVVTDWMAARMIDLGWIQELDKSKMPNVS